MNIAILYQIKEPPQAGNIRKPIKKAVRGRGTQGVSVINNVNHLSTAISHLLSEEIYGTEFIAVAFLSGKEITIPLFPPDKTTHPPTACRLFLALITCMELLPTSAKLQLPKTADPLKISTNIQTLCTTAQKLTKYLI